MRIIKNWKASGVIAKGKNKSTLYIKLERVGMSLLGIEGDAALKAENRHELQERENEYVIRIRKPLLRGKR